MSTRSNETIWPALIFLWTWWAFTQYPALEAYGYPGAIVLWFVGMIAARTFSSTVHLQGFWGWVLLLEVAGWYALAFFAPLHPVSIILILWGVATPLLFVGNVWRRTHERFPPIHGLLTVTRYLMAAATVVAVPVAAWRFAPGFWLGLAQASCFAAAGWLCLWYGWRLAAPPPAGQYDARLGSAESFRQRGFSHER